MEIERHEVPGKHLSHLMFPTVRFQMALVPADQIKPEKSIGLTRKSLYSRDLILTKNFRNWA